jgi:hypothetical protein
MAGPAPWQKHANRQATVLRRRYMPYEYQLIVAASQMQRGQGRAALPSLLNGLVAYWKLDETSGTRFDSAGTNNLTDSSSVGATIGKQGNAASFVASSSDYLTLASSSFGLTDAMSLSFWVKLSATGTFMTLFQLGEPSTPGSWLLQKIDTGALRFVPYPTTINDFHDSPVLLTSTGIWYHVVFTINSSGAALVYLNGSSNAMTGTRAIGSSGSLQFSVGRRDDLASQYFDGAIDEPGIWSRVLTSGAGGEIGQLYNGGAALTYPFS